tara:strand:- start:70 stop:2319 length:2250 start_codon:yes stop_codon:yes gene_type:complete
MASIIRVKRSTGTVAPASLNFGELGLTVGVGTHGNKGGRLFAGDNSQNAQVIGGRYYTDLLSIAPGLVSGQANPTTPANGFVAILDQNRKVDQWNVDNITIDGNTVSSTNTDGDINIDPNGSGEIVIPDDTFLSFGAGKDAKIEYDENGTDKIQVTGADWNYADGVAISVSDTTASSSPTTGALTVTGGVGFATDLNVGGAVDIDFDLNVDGGDITTNQTTFNLLNTTATNVSFASSATTLVIGNDNGNFNVDATGNTDLGGDLNVDGDEITTSQTTFNLLDTTATTINFGGAATTVDIGAATGQVTIVSTDQATSVNTGALEVEGGVGIAKNLHVGGDLILTGNQSITGITTFTNDVVIQEDLSVQGNTTLGNGPGDQLLVTGVSTFTGNITHNGGFVNSGGVVIDNVGISSNVISTRSGGGNTLFIDPYPDGLSNEGLVIVKGDLQVDGTTTTVNSSSVTVNEPIFNLGDVTSVRSVMSPVASGVSTVTVDSVVGINTGDVLTVANIDAAGFSTVTSYDTTSKVITFSGTTTAGISTTAQITVTHAYDTNTDRGISFDYNTSSGTGNNKVGFFGYNDSAGEESSAPARSWTYIPDASVSNSTVAGTRGFLDIKGIYYQTNDFAEHGITYFDADGLQTSTPSPGTATSTRTSTQLLTAVTEITLALPSTATIAQDAQVTQQNNASAYGVCKTSITNGSTLTLIGVQGTFDTTNDLVVNGASISITPNTVTTVYTDRPLWTDTLDGGTF